jgi:hypothetical protein
MLAALPEHHDLFRQQTSHSPRLMSDGIKCDPQALSLEQIQAEAWRVLEPKYWSVWITWRTCFDMHNQNPSDRAT